MARYTYGDSDLAADRLALVASVFEPASRAFLAAAAPYGPELAMDLGCGPGHTTRMLHAQTGARRTVGLDGSVAHVERGWIGSPASVSFAVHDVTVVPLPGAPADVIYARLLLAHLDAAAAVVHAWSTQLMDAGVLLLDDLEDIGTDDEVFRTYLDEVALAVVRRAGGALLVGPALHTMDDPPGTSRTHDDVVTFTPQAKVTARIFAMNLAVLTERGEIPPRPDLAAALEAIAQGRTVASPPAWSMRQVAFIRGCVGPPRVK